MECLRLWCGVGSSLAIDARNAVRAIGEVIMRKIIMLLLMLLGIVTNSLAQSPSAAPIYPAGAALPSPATGTLVAIVGSAKGLVVAGQAKWKFRLSTVAIAD